MTTATHETVTERAAILAALDAWIRQRPGLDYGNYASGWNDVDGRRAYFRELRSIARDLREARALLATVGWRESITAERERNPGILLKESIMRSVEPKCHVILFDTSLNSRFTVFLNIYQIFLLSAHKMERHAAVLKRVSSNEYFLGVIESLSTHFHHLIQERMTNALARSMGAMNVV